MAPLASSARMAGAGERLAGGEPCGQRVVDEEAGGRGGLERGAGRGEDLPLGAALPEGLSRPPRRADGRGTVRPRRGSVAGGRCGHSRERPEVAATSAQCASAIRSASSWKALPAVHCSGAWGASAPTSPPEAPAPMAAASMRWTLSPRRAASQAQERPMMPPPTVRSCLAIRRPLAHGRARNGIGEMTGGQQAELAWRDEGDPGLHPLRRPLFQPGRRAGRDLPCLPGRQRPAGAPVPRLPGGGTGLRHRAEPGGAAPGRAGHGAALHHLRGLPQ